MPSSGQDAERALTVSGSEEVEEVAACIRALKMEFDIIATSPLKRASETAEVVAKALKQAGISPDVGRTEAGRATRRPSTAVSLS
jgi:phosphohistidine phosphatase SixA